MTPTCGPPSDPNDTIPIVRGAPAHARANQDHRPRLPTVDDPGAIRRPIAPRPRPYAAYMASGAVAETRTDLEPLAEPAVPTRRRRQARRWRLVTVVSVAVLALVVGVWAGVAIAHLAGWDAR